MKKIIGFSLLVLFLGFVFTPGVFAQNQKKVKVLTTFYPVYIMALNVAGDIPNVEVMNLTKPFTGCLHDYSLTVEDMRKLADVDILIANGSGAESFLNKALKQFPRLKIVELSKNIDTIKSANGDINPHTWVSIKNAIIEVENLSEAMQEFDPKNSGIYKSNAGEYTSKLKDLNRLMHYELSQYKAKKIITFHEAFPYFAKEFDLIIASVVEREPGSAPNPKELSDTIDLIKKLGIKSLFSEPQYPAIAANTISKETGAKVYSLDPAVTGPDNKDAYVNIMKKNLGVLKEALK